MFLFTTPAASPQAPAAPLSLNPAQVNQAQAPVVNAIRNGADKTGTGFDFLLKTAQRESALDPNAKARTSSATGLFQFIEQTWLSTVKTAGGKHGMQAYSDAIQPTDAGRLTVSDPTLRDEILSLRKDPAIAAVMAGEFTQKNRDQLASAIGRTPGPGDLYAAHVLGARGAADLIRAAETNPGRRAALDFPDAAAANRGIFFDKAGQPRSVQDVYGILSSSHAGLATAGEPTAASHGAATEIAAALSPGRAKGLIGLFSTEGPRGPVSESVAKLWTGQRALGVRVASLDPGQRFFPRAGGHDETPSGFQAAQAFQPASAAILQDAPEPPLRPAELSPAQLSAGGVANPSGGGRHKGNGLPLDLSTFLLARARP
jgi:hypothetical protein